MNWVAHFSKRDVLDVRSYRSGHSSSKKPAKLAVSGLDHSLNRRVTLENNPREIGLADIVIIQVCNDRKIWLFRPVDTLPCQVMDASGLE